MKKETTKEELVSQLKEIEKKETVDCQKEIEEVLKKYSRSLIPFGFVDTPRGRIEIPHLGIVQLGIKFGAN